MISAGAAKQKPVRNRIGSAKTAVQLSTAPSRAATIRMAVPLKRPLVEHHSNSPKTISSTRVGVARIAS